MKTNTRQVVLIACLAAILEVSKIALQAVPNIELVTFLFILYTLCLGWKTLWIVPIFIGCETLIWGINTWVIMYAYLWPLLIALTMWLHKHTNNVWWYCLLSCLFGLFFGAFCSIVYLFIGGWQTAFSWWVAGIPYDIAHGIGNLVVARLLFHPVYNILKNLVTKNGSLQP